MTTVLIEGAGLAGQVLHRELYLKGIRSGLVDKAIFPREKVCGGALQWDSWQYLNSIFDIQEKVKTIHAINHFWRGKRISRVGLKVPMVYISRYVLDNSLYRQQQLMEAGTEPLIRVVAAGVQNQRGDWLGFQGPIEPVEELEMHYGRGIYLGITPTLEDQSHAAFIVKKSLFKNTERLRDYIKKELGLNIRGPLKGTKDIHYHESYYRGLAIGDAKLTTHPFLGLGMKHAILSARLMACLIASDKVEDYPKIHRRLFRKYRWASLITGRIYDSPFRFILRLILKNPSLFLSAYYRLHRDHNFFGNGFPAPQH
jgi:flavin-dependent dehydrogenase